MVRIYDGGASGEIEFKTLKECQSAASIIKKTFKARSAWDEFLCLEKTK